MPRLASRLSRIKPSSTMAVTAKLLELRAAGRDVVGFAAGEPDFDTWPSVCRAAHDAIDAGAFRYTAVGGTPELKAAICKKLERDNGLSYRSDEVLASCGGKHALFTAMQAVLDDGDDVLVPAPFWVSYPDMAALCGGVARYVHAAEERGFLLTPEELGAALRPQTRLVVLNSPSNPTGATYSEEQMLALGRVLADHDCWVLLDDVYEFIRYDDRRPRHLLAMLPELRERAIVANSVSKTYAMTGWRLGYTAAPADLVGAMATLQGQSTSNPSTIAQAAATEALSGPQDALAPMVAEFRRRRDYVVDRVASIEGLSMATPGGAFYAFINASGVFEKTGAADGDALALAMLEGAAVAAVGGNDFGSPDHFRISYATSMDQIERGLDRIAAWLDSY